MTLKQGVSISDEIAINAIHAIRDLRTEEPIEGCAPNPDLQIDWLSIQS